MRLFKLLLFINKFVITSHFFIGNETTDYNLPYSNYEFRLEKTPTYISVSVITFSIFTFECLLKKFLIDWTKKNDK